MSVSNAPIKWAQRKDSIYLTITLRDVKNETVSLTDKTLKFSGESDGQKYAVELEFLKDIESEGSVFKVNPSSVHFKLNKKNTEEPFWPRLLMDKSKEKNQVSADWSRWVDEDEGPEDFNLDGVEGGSNFGGMGGMPGMGGMGGMGGMMGGMPGMGGMGGMGGMDFEKMMAQMRAGGGMPDFGGEEGVEGEQEGDSDDDADVNDLN